MRLSEEIAFRRNIVTVALAFLAGSLLAVGTGKLFGLGALVEAAILGVGAIVFVSALLLVWRCPNCDAYLGRYLFPKSCPRCDASFK